MLVLHSLLCNVSPDPPRGDPTPYLAPFWFDAVQETNPRRRSQATRLGFLMKIADFASAASVASAVWEVPKTGSDFPSVAFGIRLEAKMLVPSADFR